MLMIKYCRAVLENVKMPQHFLMIWYDIDIFVNWNWVASRWE